MFDVWYINWCIPLTSCWLDIHLLAVIVTAESDFSLRHAIYCTGKLPYEGWVWMVYQCIIYAWVHWWRWLSMRASKLIIVFTNGRVQKFYNDKHKRLVVNTLTCYNSNKKNLCREIKKATYEPPAVWTCKTCWVNFI